MEDVLPLVTGAAPWVTVITIVLGLFTVLLRALSTGQLLTRGQVDDILAAHEAVTDLYKETARIAGERLDRQAGTLDVLLEAAKASADNMDALRRIAERENS